MNVEFMHLQWIIRIAILCVNCIFTVAIFPGRLKKYEMYIVLIIYTIILYSLLLITGSLYDNKSNMRGLVYFIVFLILLKGPFFQKTFAFFQQYLLTLLIFSFYETLFILLFGIPVNTVSKIIYCVLNAIIYGAYVFVLFRYGVKTFKRLFSQGNNLEWLVYSLGVIFSYVLLIVSDNYVHNLIFKMLILFFIIWNFVILCFAIINTYEKSRQHFEADFARSIISSGKEHFNKMNEMYDEMRILKHDQKYHYNVIHELVDSGKSSEAQKYLDELKKQLLNEEIPIFCNSIVVNALLEDYAKRCKTENILFKATIFLPTNLSISDYELCIVIGNLLENALEACLKNKSSSWIEVVVKPKNVQLAIMVKNSIVEKPLQKEKELLSTKQSGGLGLKSVKSVVSKFGGEFIFEYDEKTFTVFVLIKL